MNRSWISPAALALVVAQLSCATGLTPLPQSMPAARAGLLPEYRIFYDTLQDYGDWTLIEPYGFVFRPRSVFASWQPYSDGFWVPTDLYGWVWVSSEPFGWATYHYGQWFHDSFQGWVWKPGLEWAPAWVDWRVSDNYVGWAPIGPNGVANPSSYRFVESSQLGVATNLRDVASTPQQLGAVASQARPVENQALSDGTRFNRGPSIEWVERRTGPLARVQIDDLIPSAPAQPPVLADAEAPAPRNAGPAPDSVAAVRRAADRATSDARAQIRTDTRVQQVRAVRPFGVPDVAVKPPAPRTRPATPAKRSTKGQPAPRGTAADSTR
jgi:hypothetical protein